MPSIGPLLIHELTFAFRPEQRAWVNVPIPGYAVKCWSPRSHTETEPRPALTDKQIIAEHSVSRLARYALPDADERTFCDVPGKHLNRYGTTIQAFGIVDEKTHRQSYGLVLSRGTKRQTLISELPFSWEGPEAVIDRLRPWLEGGDVGAHR